MSEIKIRLVPNWCDGDFLRDIWNRMTPNGDYKWNSIKMLHSSDKTIEDYQIIINKPREYDIIKPYKTILFPMEPKMHFDREQISAYNEDCNESNNLYYMFTPKYGGRNNLEWHLSKTYSELYSEKIEKTKIISAIISGLTFNSGHKLRVDFLKYLTQIPGFDLYGRDPLPYSSYKGSLPFYAKDDGLFPYKYTFTAENCRERNYFTEKIVDAILSESLCFYWGCPNLSEFIDPMAFIWIDIDKPDIAIRQITDAISNNEWDKRINIIRKEKIKILNELQFFPTLERVIFDRQDMCEFLRSKVEVYRTDVTKLYPFEKYDIHETVIKGTEHELWQKIADTNIDEKKWIFVIRGEINFDHNFVALFKDKFQEFNTNADIVKLGYENSRYLAYAIKKSTVKRVIANCMSSIDFVNSSTLRVYDFKDPNTGKFVMQRSHKEFIPEETIKRVGEERRAGNNKNAYQYILELEANVDDVDMNNIRNREIYNFNLLDEILSVVFYVNLQQKAHEAARQLIKLLRDNVPETVNNVKNHWDRILQNMRFYNCPDLCTEFSQVVDDIRNNRIIQHEIPSKPNVQKAVAFHDNTLCERGTTIALYDYAYYNEKLLGNRSIIFYKMHEPRHNAEILARFMKQFKCIAYDNFEEVNTHIKGEKIDAIYIIKYGNLDDKIVKSCRNLIHAVFANQPHGDKYAFVSEWMTKNYNNTVPFVPHMIDLPNCSDNMRQSLGIPLNATVFGRYGGLETFDIPFVHYAITATVAKRQDVYFLFANTDRFTSDHHPQIIHINALTDRTEKVKFINTCDAMLHARERGETFGIAVGEFSTLNKPVITFNGSFERAHIDLLGDKGIYYNDYNELYSILNDHDVLKRHNDWNCYRDFTPEIVMRKFDTVFLSDLECCCNKNTEDSIVEVCTHDDIATISNKTDKWLLILENPSELHADFIDRFTKTAESIPDDAEVVYCNIESDTPYDNDSISAISTEINENIVRLSQNVTGMYAFKQRVAEKLLENNMKVSVYKFNTYAFKGVTDQKVIKTDKYKYNIVYLYGLQTTAPDDNLLYNCIKARESNDYKKAYDYVCELVNVCSKTEREIYYFTMWDELASISYYVDKEKGIYALRKLVEYYNEAIPETLEGFSIHCERILKNSRFLDCDETISTLEVIYDKHDNKSRIDYVDSQLDIYCINLAKSTDRWQHTQAEFAKFGLNVTRFEAIDGYTLDFDDLIKQKIVTEDLDATTKMQKGAWGIIVSSEKLWRHIAEENTGKWTLIVEDDVCLHPDFLSLFQKYWKTIPSDAEIVYFGFGSHHSYNNSGVGQIGTAINHGIMKITFQMGGCGCFAYAISPGTAARLLQHQFPRTGAIDVFSIEIFNIYAFTRPLDTTPEMITNFYTDTATNDGKEGAINIYGIASLRQNEPSTLGHYKFTLLNRCRSSRDNRNFIEAYNCVSELIKICPQDLRTLYYFNMWDELITVAYYVNKPDEARHGIKKLIEYYDNGIIETVEGFRNHGIRVLANSAFYDCPDLCRKLRNIIDDLAQIDKYRIVITSDVHDSDYYCNFYKNRVVSVNSVYDYVVVVNSVHANDTDKIDFTKAILLTYDKTDTNPFEYILIKTVDRNVDILKEAQNILKQKRQQSEFINSKLTMYCINLERSHDRWNKCMHEFKRYNLNVTRFEAVDGNTTSYDDLLKQNIVTDRLDEVTRVQKGALGIIASTVKLWREIAAGPDDNKWTLIMEDDVKFHPDFVQMFADYWNSVPEDAEIIFVGYQHPWCCDPYDNSVVTQISNNVNDYVIKLHTTVNGNHAYAINKKTAIKLLERFVPVSQAIDKFPTNTINIYAFKRPQRLDRRIVENVYIDREIWENNQNVVTFGLIGTRSEKSTITHLPFHLMWFVDNEIKNNKNPAKALEFLVDMTKDLTIYTSDVANFDIWYKIIQLAHTVNKHDLGISAIHRLIKLKDVKATQTGMIQNEADLLNNIRCYNSPDLYYEFKMIIDSVKNVSENIGELINLLRILQLKGDNQKAYEYILKIINMRDVVDPLYKKFVEFELWDLLITVAYYVNKKEKGRYAFNKLMDLVQNNTGVTIAGVSRNGDRILQNMRFYDCPELCERFERIITSLKKRDAAIDVVKFHDYTHVIPLGDHQYCAEMLTDLGVNDDDYPFDDCCSFFEMFETNFNIVADLVNRLLDGENTIKLVNDMVGDAWDNRDSYNTKNNLWFTNIDQRHDDLINYIDRFTRLKHNIVANEKCAFVTVMKCADLQSETLLQLISTLVKYNSENVLILICGKEYVGEVPKNVVYKHVKYDDKFKTNVRQYLSSFL